MLPDRFRRALAGITPYFCFLLAVATLGPLQFGFHLAELNAPQDAITCRSHGNVSSKPASLGLPECIPMTEASFAAVSSAFTAGGLAGALAAGPICSTRGRRAAMLIASALFIAGSGFETLATSILLLAFGRVLNGASAGASTVIVPLYISEIAPLVSRGFFGAFTQITVNVGILFTQTLGFFLSRSGRWRYILGSGIVLGMFNLVGLLFLAESPKWLATQKGDVEVARQTLQRIRGPGVVIDDEVALWPESKRVSASAPDEEQSLLEAHSAERPASSERSPSPMVSLMSGTAPIATALPQSAGFLDIARDSRYRPALIAVIGVMFAQQLCGINSVIMYSVSLLNGMLPLSSGLLTILISVVNLAVTLGCAPLPDRLGRKTCLLVSAVGQGSSALALALSIVFGVKMMSALSVLSFVAFFAVGLGPVPFMLASELVEPEAVGATQSWALGSNYIATFLVAQFFPMVNSALNAHFGGAGWVYFLFASFAALSTCFLLKYVPETLGKKDADEVWGRTSRLD